MPSPKPDKRLVGGTGRSAACRVCTGTEGTQDACACIMDCGHPKCTGTKRTDVVEPSYPTRWADDKRRSGNNPKGLGGPTGKQPPAEALEPPKYDGPRGKGAAKEGKRWGRGRPT